MLIFGICGFSILGIMLGLRFYYVDIRVLIVPFSVDFNEAGIMAVIIIFAVAGGWVFVDFILIVSGKMKDKYGKHVRK